MTEAELDAFLQGEALVHTIDIRTLVVDHIRKLDETAILALFNERLPHLDEATLRHYLFMKRS